MNGIKTVNKKLRYVIKIVVFLGILIIAFQITNNILKRKKSYQKMEDFFNQEENFDVLFFGSSHMYNSIYPMDLWKKHGIISYNMANSNETVAMSYYNMLLALKYTNPKLVVIDAYTIYSKTKIMENTEEYMHDLLDAYPLSYTKYLAIQDLFAEENKRLDRYIEHLFNFSKYHSRWGELEANDFKIEKEHEKGADTIVNVATPNKMSNFNKVYVNEEEENINIIYLRKIIEYCKENNIEILVTYIPFAAADYHIALSKYIYKVCEEYNVNYINFLSMNIINYNTDCFDPHSHINVSGARKVTEYIGKYIIDNYEVKDQRNNKAYSFWYEDYDKYIDYKIKLLNDNKGNINNYLILLYGEQDIKYEIKIFSKKEIKEGNLLYNLLNNVGNNYQIDDKAFEENMDKTIKITIWDTRNGKLIDTVWW